MSSKRIPRETALEIAEIIVAKLTPFCERIEIAGSIRREMFTVKDIELVCIPRTEVLQEGLFGDPGETVNLLRQKLDSMVADSFLDRKIDDEGKQCWGDKYQRAVFRDGSLEVGVDVFSVIPPAQWGVIFAIRTGNYEFSRNLVTQQRYGGYMPDDMRVSDGALWRVSLNDRDHKLGVIHTPEEEDFFEAIGFHDYPPPTNRNIVNTMPQRMRGRP